jgi:hypothetical protein
MKKFALLALVLVGCTVDTSGLPEVELEPVDPTAYETPVHLVSTIKCHAVFHTPEYNVVDYQLDVFSREFVYVSATVQNYDGRDFSSQFWDMGDFRETGAPITAQIPNSRDGLFWQMNYKVSTNQLVMRTQTFEAATSNCTTTPAE